MINRYQFSRRLEKELEKQGLRQVDLSRMTGITDSTISRYVNGHTHRGIRAEYVRRIADALGVTCEYLGMTEVEK